METQITKPQQPAGNLETLKRSYSTAWETAFKEIMFLLGEHYGIELLIEIPETRQRVTSPAVKFWEESLRDLSPQQMREGLRNYMSSERGNFKPNPEEIKANAPAEAADKPRVKVNPDCLDCHGLGWKQATSADGKPLKAVTRCECRVIEYQGNTYTPAPRQLPAARPDPEKVRQVETRVEQVAQVKRFPVSNSHPLSDAELKEKAREAEIVAKRFAK